MTVTTDEDELATVDFPGLAAVAMQAVGRLWRAELGTFARATIDTPVGLRPTVTFRCTEVLVAAAATAPELLHGHHEMLDAARSVVADASPEEALDESDLAYPPFTLALQTLAKARLAREKGDTGNRARATIPSMVDALVQKLGLESETAEHPFVEEHALRALNAARPYLDDPAVLDGCVTKLIQSVRASTEHLLAKHHMSLISPAESVVLAFCAAALSTTRSTRDDKFAFAALRAAAEAQDASGSWPLGRVVRDDPGRLEISTYEVAWVTAATLERLLERDACSIDNADTTEIVESVARAGRFTERSIVEVEEHVRGWASDHPYQEPRVESWTSAIVLQFALAATGLRADVRNRRVLASFSSISPRDPSRPTWLTWDALSTTAEPDSDHPVYGYLEKYVIDPIACDPRRLPSGSRECASVLLFGPPGTAKTTIVKAVALRLGWPLVMLSPGSFIEKGLEAIEASARSVFDRLQQLRRVVVIFDECDELFRKRDPSGNPDQMRGISAFVTASMLPKLQDLHDRGQVLFFICTNHVDMMDSAVVRGGRMDHRIGVPSPDHGARAHILEELTKDVRGVEHLESAVKLLTELSERFNRSELKRAVLKLLEGAKLSPWSSAAEADEAVRHVVTTMSDSLTITTAMRDEFKEHQAKWSDPVLLGAR